MDQRKLVAEAFGTAALVYFAVGVATLSFGFGTTGEVPAAGVVATALAFGLVLLVLAYSLGSISGCHVNPAVSLGFFLSKRLSSQDLLGYWVAQIVGGIVGAFLLWLTFQGSSVYNDETGLGQDGYGDRSMVDLNVGGALLAEIILTFLFVFVVLSVTRAAANPAVAAVAVGLALTVVHLVGIPLTGTSVNPARSIASAVFAGNGDAWAHLWLFIVAPLVGGGLAAFASTYFHGQEPAEAAA